MWPLDQIRKRFARTPALPAEVQRATVTFSPMYGTPNAEKVVPNFESYASQAYGCNAAVFAVSERRRSLFSEGVLKYRKLSDKKIEGFSSLYKLEHPWPDGTTGDLLSRMIQDVDLMGNAYIRNAGDRLERLRPDWVTIVSQVVLDEFGEEIREIIGYYYEPIGDPDRTDAYYPVAEVAHWAPIPDPLTNYSGMSWLSPIVREINADIRMSEFRDAFFENAATPNVVIRYQKALSPAANERLKMAFEAEHTGVANAFGSIVLDEGADLTIVGANMQGSAFRELQAAGESRIASASGVPALIAGFREGMDASQIGEYQQAMRAFADITMRPLWRSACAALAKLVAVPAGYQLWYDTTDISALQQGEQDAATTSQIQAATIASLVMIGYTRSSVQKAVVAGDMSLLEEDPNFASVQLKEKSPPTTPETEV